ncbi:MAG TPA: hypothetical protein VGS22_11400 [Thermoanaerobaculia bacterium]|nr:hypothetical protein [Thermoanaerobaculia bacterium]
MAEGELKLDAEVLDVNGKSLAQAAIELAERKPAVPGEPDWLVATFRAPDLVPGDYWLRVRWAGGSAEAPGTGVSGASRFIIR